MPVFQYEAMDAKGKPTKGTLEVANQSEALTRLKEMGYFPTKVVESDKGKDKGKEKDKDKKDSKDAKGGAAAGGKGGKGGKKGAMEIKLKIPGFGGSVGTKTLCNFTRQLATLVDAGLPLLRGLIVLQKGEKDPTLREILGKLAVAIEGGSTFSEALAQHPKTFNKLFVNMVKAGELGGVLEVTLTRLAEFAEKAEKIKGKVKAALFYPVAVMTVAVGIVALLMIVVVPKFKEIFKDMLGDQGLPEFTMLVLTISEFIQHHFLVVAGGCAAFVTMFKLFVRTKFGARWTDKMSLYIPVFGEVIKKVAISRFTRTLGTLISSGVPILQSLNIVRETSSNIIFAEAVQAIHDSVKEGETIVGPLEASKIFPPMVVSMVDVGEQTGALPEMLMKVADNYEEEVDNAVSAMTSLLEPIMIVFLAVVVGSIVIAMFLPLIKLMDSLGSDGGGDVASGGHIGCEIACFKSRLCAIKQSGCDRKIAFGGIRVRHRADMAVNAENLVQHDKGRCGRQERTRDIGVKFKTVTRLEFRPVTHHAPLSRSPQARVPFKTSPHRARLQWPRSRAGPWAQSSSRRPPPIHRLCR